MTCNAKVNTKGHTCKEILTNNEEAVGLSQTCLGCNQEFHSMHTFETHIKKEHSEDAEYFFFPDINSEFQKFQFLSLRWQTTLVTLRI